MPESKTKPQGAPDVKAIMADYDKAVPFFANTPAEAWEAIGQRTALSVFGETVKDIPAYQDFLKLKKFNPSDVKLMEDFYKIPLTDKYNYIQTFGFNEVNSTQTGKDLYSFSLSSGTIDQPTIWPRYYSYEEFLPVVFNIFLRQYWQVDQKSTLLINAFALGPWMAGVSIHAAVRPLTQKYRLTMATTGADIDSILYSIIRLSKDYDQTLIFSYPTFARTIIDKLEDSKVNIRKLNLKMFIAGEGHTVEWRQYINKMISGDAEDVTSIIDGYGITDTGLCGMGTALTNLVRDLAHKNEKLREELFGKTDCIPTLFQYNPGTYFIEENNGEVVITTKSTTPLVRYNVHDRGGVISFRKMEEILEKHGYNYKQIIEKKKLSKEIVWQQPFVYCFGRRDDTVSIGGANIFPEQISPALFNDKVKDIHSFKITTGSDSKQRTIFYVLLELRNGLKVKNSQLKKLEKKYHDIIFKQLKSVNFDFADAFRVDPKVSDPKIQIFENGTGPFLSDIGKTKPTLLVKR